MAKRFTDTELWDKEWFMKLPTKLKCLVKLIRDKCDLSGVWSPNWMIANTYIGEPVCEQELLEIDNGNQFKKLENGKIICVDFIDFQYGKLSPASPVHRKIMSILNTHKIPYQYPINRVQEEEEEEDKDKEEEKDKEKEGKKKSKKVIPTEIEFMAYCREILIEKYPALEFSIKAKYNAWIEAGWKDGYGVEIKNWKTKIMNVVPHLKPEYNKQVQPVLKAKAFSISDEQKQANKEYAEKYYPKAIGANPTNLKGIGDMVRETLVKIKP